MDTRTIGVLAGVVGTLSLVLKILPEWFLNQWQASGFESELLITLGTPGTTFVTYSVLLAVLVPLVTVALALGLGYIVGRRIDVVAEYGRFVGAVAVGSTVPVLAGGAVSISLGTFMPVDVWDVVIALLLILQYVVSVSLVVTVGAIAGAALAHFRTTESTPAQPMTADTTTKASTTVESSSDHEDQHSQPTR